MRFGMWFVEIDDINVTVFILQYNYYTLLILNSAIKLLELDFILKKYNFSNPLFQHTR